MTPPLPRLRRDLTIVERRVAGEPACVVKDPATGSFFLLGPVERFLAEHLDGATSADQVRERCERRFGSPLPADALERFVTSLERAGLLEAAEGEPRPARRAPGRWRGNWLRWRLKLADPDRFLDALARRSGFVFTRGFAVACGVLLLAAVAVAAASWTDMTRDMARLYRVSALPAIWLTLWIVIAGHELSHGLACKRFGGEVHELGVMLLYLTPAAYCNVSDAWLFPDKRRRVLVSLAGPWFELLSWSLATLAWRVTEAESPIRFVALVVALTSGIKTLINLNPLLKLDGYYLLSDQLEIPNLRRRAFRRLGLELRALFGRADAGDETSTDDVGPRERRIYLAYGALAIVFSIGFLAFAIAKLGRYLAGGRTLALALALGLLSAKLPRRMARFFPRPGSQSGDDEDWDPDVPEPEPQPQPERGTEPPSPEAPAPGGSPRVRRGLARLARVLAIAAAAVGVLSVLPMQLQVGGPFRALPRRDADVRAEVDGIVDQVSVHEGDQVRAGQLIVRLSSRDLDAALGELEAEIDQQRARLRLLEAGPRPEDVDVARAGAATAEAHVPFAERRLEMNRTLFGMGVVSKKELQQSEEEAVTAAHEAEEARARLDAVSKGARPDEIVAARSALGGLEVRHRLLEEERRLLDVRSPVDGVVATPEADLRELDHRLLAKGDRVAEVHDDRVITAEIAVSEQDIGDVQVGRRVKIKARACPEQTFHGVVTAVATTAQATPAAGGGAATASASAAQTPRRVVVDTEIDNRALLLKPEMTGEARILCGKTSALAILLRALARTLRVEFWPWS